MGKLTHQNYKRQNVGGFVLKVLQSLGGSAPKQSIKEGIVEDKEISLSYDDVFVPQKSKKSGKEYIPFNFDFNFALKELLLLGYIEEYNRNTDIVLTEKGRTCRWDTYPNPSEWDQIHAYWDAYAEKRKEANSSEDPASKSTGEDQEEEKDAIEQWKIDVLTQIKKFSPRKFESFSRLLLSKMGIKFDKEKGVQMSGDHGIDGYGIFVSDEFRTSKVVVQCKRFTGGPVGEPEIDKFKGVMMKHSADYGIFVTTTYFTEQAKKAAVQGNFTVTLIDGQELVKLIEKYRLHVTPITTYELDKYYFEEE